jgi:hypothetical protein
MVWVGAELACEISIADVNGGDGAAIESELE